jgi:hypothetical protein
MSTKRSLLSSLLDIGNYEQRKVANETINGITISTAYTSDEGFETALFDSKNGGSVERYEDKEKAIEGHKKWVKKVKDGLTSCTILPSSHIPWMMPEKINLRLSHENTN